MWTLKEDGPNFNIDSDGGDAEPGNPSIAYDLLAWIGGETSDITPHSIPASHCPFREDDYWNNSFGGRLYCSGHIDWALPLLRAMKNETIWAHHTTQRFQP